MSRCVFPIDVIREIPGWTSEQALVVTSFTVSLLSDLKPGLVFLELGVFKGRFLTYVSTILPSDSKIVGVDAMYERNGIFLKEEYALLAKNEIIENVLGASGKVPDIYIGLSENFFQSNSSRFDLIHVDASHESEQVMLDVLNSARNLNEGGVLILDDLFNGALPGVTEGFFSAERFESLNISAFAYAGNKTFFCRPNYHDFYYKGLQQLTTVYEKDFMCIQGTRKRSEENSLNNLEPKLLGFPLNVFLE
jgi:hypothetical protein